ncbi:MAG: hypothetical protein PHR38_10025 [Bacteroidales bacterium]|nr:hypothetical protein [Bacteroidales bacterium]
MKKLSNHVRAYFDEFVFMLDMIVVVLCFSNDFKFVGILLSVKAFGDLLCAIKYAVRSVNEERKIKPL